MSLEEFGRQLVQYSLSWPDHYNEANTRLYLLNYLGACASGKNDAAVKVLVSSRKKDGTGIYHPLYIAGDLPLSSCVLLDCFCSSVQAYDDIHFATSTHPCGPVASAVIGICRMRRISLSAAAAALHIGMEAECRIMMAVHGLSAGWYPTGIAGGIGAAAAAGRLLDLNEDQMRSALGLAAASAGGVRGTHGSMAGTFVPAAAAENGLRAALMSADGFTCSLASLTGPNGLLCQLKTQPDTEEASVQGISFADQTSCKPYPLGYISFPVIDCAGQFHERCEDITHILLKVSARAFQLGRNPHPQDASQAIVSLPYILACTLLDADKIRLPLSQNFHISEEEKKLMEKITIEPDASLQDDQAALSIQCGDREYQFHCRHAEGSASRPMGRQAVIAKYRKIASNPHADDLIHLMLAGETDDLYADLCRLQ